MIPTTQSTLVAADHSFQTLASTACDFLIVRRIDWHCTVATPHRPHVLSQTPVVRLP